MLAHRKEPCRHRHIHVGLTEGDHISLLSRLSLISSLVKRRLVIHSETRIFQVSSQKRREIQSGEGELLFLRSSVVGAPRRASQRRAVWRKGRLTSHSRLDVSELQKRAFPLLLLSEGIRKGLLGELYVCA